MYGTDSVLEYGGCLYVRISNCTCLFEVVCWGGGTKIEGLVLKWRKGKRDVGFTGFGMSQDSLETSVERGMKANTSVSQTTPLIASMVDWCSWEAPSVSASHTHFRCSFVPVAITLATRASCPKRFRLTHEAAEAAEAAEAGRLHCLQWSVQD